MLDFLRDLGFGGAVLTALGAGFWFGMICMDQLHRLDDNAALTKARKKAAADILPTIASRRDAWAPMADEITEAVEMAEWSRHG